MTLIEAIQRIDALKPNTYSQTDKIRWLSTVDSTVKQIIDRHEGGEDVVFEPYTEETPQGQILLVPAPFDDVYLYWIAAQIDFWDREMGMYNNNMTMYTSALNEFERHYRRSHMPKERKFKFF